MPTATTHAPFWTLIRRTDLVSTHLIIYAHGAATSNTLGNHFSAPPKKRIHFYTPHGTTLAVSQDTVRRMTEGHYVTHELVKNQHSYRNYALTKIVTGGTAAHPHHHVTSSANLVNEAVLDVIVNASGGGGPGKPQGAGEGELGNDQPCDVLSIRHRAIGAVVGHQVELVSLLGLHELKQYRDIHCVFCRAKGTAPAAAAPANRPLHDVPRHAPHRRPHARAAVGLRMGMGYDAVVHRPSAARAALCVLSVLLVGCRRSSTPTPDPASSRGAAAVAPGTCGPLGCMQFDDVGQALAVVLARKPLVIGFGEAHAQRGKEGIPSSAKHFTDELLPVLAPRSSDLVLELMTPAKRPDGTGCAETAAAVKDKQKVVTAPQAASNPSEYVTMGEAARKLGVVPDLLRPTCEDLAAIDKAGDDMIVLTLETTARLTQQKVAALLERNAKSEGGKEKIVLSYGGGMHNDMSPPKERAAWSYGPELTRRTGGRYAEIDLYVSDFVEPTDIWKKMPWYPHYDRERLGDRITMYEPTPGSFVILLPRRKQPG